MSDVKPLRNLNNLRGGIKKQWIWQHRENYYKSNDYLQKINYCIQDLNHEIMYLANPSMKEAIYTIVLVDWIREAVDALPALLSSGALDRFVFPKQAEAALAKQYLAAIRSFAVAHPLSTNRHYKFGFDGDKICVDIRSKGNIITQPFTKEEDWYHLDFGGLVSNAKDKSADFVLLIYSKETDNMRFFKYIGADFSDIYHVAAVYIEKLYAMDRYLGKLRKKDLM